MKFEEWFKERWGPEPHPEKTFNDSWINADLAKEKLKKAENKIKDREEWLSRREAALSAWNIKEKDKS